MKVTEASFNKRIETISSAEEFYKILTKCYKNHIPVRFYIPFMDKETFEKLSKDPNYPNGSWRYASGFSYQDYYKDAGYGSLKRIDRNKFVIIDPDNSNFVVDSRLTFDELYNGLVKYPEDFNMTIDGYDVEFGDKPKTLKKELSINSLDDFVKFIKKASKQNLNVTFEMPFVKKEYIKDLNKIPSYNRARYEMDPKFREKYEEVSNGKLSGIIGSKYVRIDPTDPSLTTDMRLTFNDLYNGLLNTEDYEMSVDGKRVPVGENYPTGYALSEKITDKSSLDDIINDFETSKDSRFDGKSKEERKQMAVGAYYALNEDDSRVQYLKVKKQDIPKATRLLDQYGKFKEGVDYVIGAISGRMISTNPKNFNQMSDILKKYLPADGGNTTTVSQRPSAFDSIRNQQIADKYKSNNNQKGTTNRNGVWEGKGNISEMSESEMGDNQSPIDIARRMGYDAAREGDKDKYDSSLRSLMNDHPGDKQREDIHKAFISGMDDFKDHKLEEKDLGKPGKNFDKIAAKAAKEYGSKEAGDKVAGSVLAKLRKKDPKKYTESEEIEPEDKEVKSKKYVIELSFPYDGDTDLADRIESEIGKKAELNEVLRTRRIMEFDFKNEGMFRAATSTIEEVMKSLGKKDYKLDTRTEDDVDAPQILSDEEKEEIKESYNVFVSNGRSPVMVTLPLIVESMKWASNARLSEETILKYATNLATRYNPGSCLDI